jgi:nucleoside-diphosphate-sugar epimerase
MRTQRVLVAGTSETLARRLSTALTACDHEVYGLAPDAAVMPAVAAARPTVVIHHAPAPDPLARRPDRPPSDGARQLADAAERYGVQRLIATTSASAYAHAGPASLAEDAPLDLAAPGRRGAAVRALADVEDAVLDARQVQGVVLRLGVLYGPGTAFAPGGRVHALVRRRRLPLIGDGGGRTSFVHVDDAVGAVLDALDRGWGVFNVVDDAPAAARDWLPAYAAAVGAPPPRRLPARLAASLAGRGAARAMTTQRGALNGKARRELGWQPEFADWRARLGSG